MTLSAKYLRTNPLQSKRGRSTSIFDLDHVVHLSNFLEKDRASALFVENLDLETYKKMVTSLLEYFEYLHWLRNSLLLFGANLIFISNTFFFIFTAFFISRRLFIINVSHFDAYLYLKLSWLRIFLLTYLCLWSKWFIFSLPLENKMNNYTSILTHLELLWRQCGVRLAFFAFE